MQKCNKLKNIAIVHIKESVYRIFFLYMSKSEAKTLMTNLIDKKRCFIKKKFFFHYIKNGQYNLLSKKQRNNVK